MKFEVHPTSALFGAVAATLLLLALSAQTFTATPIPPLEIRVEGIPAPDQLVRIEGGQPFTVPTGKTLVITGTACSTLSVAVSVEVDGVPRLLGSFGGQNSFSPGYAVQADSVVQAVNTSATRSWGGSSSATLPMSESRGTRPSRGDRRA